MFLWALGSGYVQKDAEWAWNWSKLQSQWSCHQLLTALYRCGHYQLLSPFPSQPSLQEAPLFISPAPRWEFRGTHFLHVLSPHTAHPAVIWILPWSCLHLGHNLLLNAGFLSAPLVLGVSTAFGPETRSQASFCLPTPLLFFPLMLLAATSQAPLHLPSFFSASPAMIVFLSVPL